MTRMDQPGIVVIWTNSGSLVTSMDFDPSSLEGESQLQVYIQVQQVSNDTDPQTEWWKQHHREFPDSNDYCDRI